MNYNITMFLVDAFVSKKNNRNTKQSSYGYFYTSDLGKTMHKPVFTNAYLDNWVILVN
jgi:hypothetical protein